MKPRRWSVTRRRLARRMRLDLVHAAGEKAIHPGCVVTSFWLDPPGALAIWAECEHGAEDLALLRSGAVSIPRSLRSLWRVALK